MQAEEEGTGVKPYYQSIEQSETQLSTTKMNFSCVFTQLLWTHCIIILTNSTPGYV